MKAGTGDEQQSLLDSRSILSRRIIGGPWLGVWGKPTDRLTKRKYELRGSAVLLINAMTI
jgi:hypothetical protein